MGVGNEIAPAPFHQGTGVIRSCSVLSYLRNYYVGEDGFEPPKV